MLPENAGDLVDVIHVQRYTVAGVRDTRSGSVADWDGGEDDPVSQVERTIETCRRHRDGLASLIAECRHRGLALHSLNAAAMIHHFCELAPNFEVSHFYHLINPMGIMIHRGAEAHETGLSGLFRLYRPAFPGRWRKVDVRATTTPEWLDVLDLSNADGTWMFLVNRHPEESLEVELAESAASSGSDVVRMTA